MSNHYFEFKQFTVIQNHSAMKVGTDGVLLGSWADIGNARTVLDIGAGTGLLSLMLAQQGVSMIDAIEIDPDACIDATNNFAKSPWKDTLQLVASDFLEYFQKTLNRYDLIISNPPFFKNSLHSLSKKKTTARHSNSLPHNQLLEGVVKLLNTEGRFFVVLPADISKDFIVQARMTGLHPEKILHVFSKKTDLQAIRTLLCFSKNDCKASEENLFIYTSAIGEYTNVYKALTKDYYLAF